MREGCGKLKKVTSSSRENLFVKMRKKILLMLLAMILVFMSGCAEEKKQIALNQSNNTSGYEFEVFLNEYNNNVPANTTTYYLLEDKTTAKVVNLEINCSKLEIYPPIPSAAVRQKTRFKILYCLLSPQMKPRQMPKLLKSFLIETKPLMSIIR